MNIVTSKKIIASMIIAIMLIGVTSPIFAATTNATVKTKTYIYSSESTGSTKKAEIYKGQTVRVSSINGNWCKISWQVTAYAHKNFVNKNGEVKGGGPNLYSDQKHTKQIGDLKTGKLTILENKKLYDNNYYKVSVNVTGYMKKTDLNIATSTTSNKPASSSSNSSGSTISILSSLLDISFGVASGIFEGLFSIFGGIGSPGEGEQPLKEKTLKLNKTSAEVKVDNTITLTATYNGKTVKPIYKSSNTKIATIDSNGKIKGIAQGETTITATYNGKKATCKVTVTVRSSNANKYDYTVAESVKNIIGNFTDADYELFIRIVYNEARSDEYLAKCVAATLINMVKYYYPGKSLTYVINKECLPWLTGNLASFNTAYKTSATKNAVQYALSGNNPTSKIENFKGGTGALNWHNDDRNGIGKANVKYLYDKNNTIRAMQVGTSIGNNMYFTGTENLKITGLHY